MNNTCPKCEALYTVAPKDIGRRLRCKKCGTPLAVTDDGLTVAADAPEAAAPVGYAPPQPPPQPYGPPPADFGPPGGYAPARPALGGLSLGPLDPLKLLESVGGVPTIVFGFGLLLVIFVGFMGAVGAAKVEGRQANLEEAELEHKKEIAAINANKELKEADKSDRIKKEDERWDKEQKSLQDSVQYARFSDRRSKYWDRYIQMFGFLLIAFGCLGYLRATQPLVLRIVAAIILTSMVLALFKGAAGGGGGVSAAVGLG